MSSEDPKDIFKEFAIKLGMNLDSDSLDILENKFAKFVEKISPILGKITDETIFEPGQLKTILESFGTDIEGLKNHLKETDPLNLFDISMFDNSKEFSNLVDAVKNGNREWIKSDDALYESVQRNEALRIAAWKKTRDELNKEGLLPNIQSLMGLDDKDAANVLLGEINDIQYAVEGFGKSLQGKNLGGQLESFGLAGQINGMITKFKILQKLSKEGLIDPAVVKNLGATGRVFLALTTAMEETGGGMAKVKAFTGVLGEGFTNLGETMAAAWAEGTLGLSLIISAVIWLGTKLAQFTGIAVLGIIDWREQLKEIDQLYGGMGDKLLEFNDQIRKTNMDLMSLGLGVESQMKTMVGFMKSGISWSRAAGSELVGTSLMVAKAFGMSEDAASGFIGKLVISNKLSETGIKNMFNQLAVAKKLTAELGLAPIAMEKFQEAVESSTEAFGLGASKGESFTKKLSADMITLTSLTTALGLGVGDIARKFEEAGNLVTNTDSKFRTLMLISGGATVREFMTGEVNRTKASMAMIDQLQKFNRALGGNIQLSSQLAEKTFGVSKDQAIKMMNMTQEEKAKQLQLMQETDKLIDGALRKNYDQVTGTIMESVNKFKNILSNIWMQIVSNPAMTEAVDSVGKSMTRLMKFFESDSGKAIIQSLSDMIGNILSKIPILVDFLIKKLAPFIEDIKNTLDGMLKSGGDSNIVENLLGLLGSLFLKLEVSLFVWFNTKLPVLFLGGIASLIPLLLDGLMSIISMLPSMLVSLVETLVTALVDLFLDLPMLIGKLLIIALKLTIETLLFAFVKLPIILGKAVFDLAWGLIKAIWKGLSFIFKFFSDPKFAKDISLKVWEGIIGMFKWLFTTIKKALGPLGFILGNDPFEKNSTSKQVEDVVKSQEKIDEGKNKELEIKSQRLDGLKETDVIYDKGEWKYVGEKRDEIEKEKMSLARRTAEALERMEKKDNKSSNEQKPVNVPAPKTTKSSIIGKSLSPDIEMSIG